MKGHASRKQGSNRGMIESRTPLHRRDDSGSRMQVSAISTKSRGSSDHGRSMRRDPAVGTDMPHVSSLQLTRPKTKRCGRPMVFMPQLARSVNVL